MTQLCNRTILILSPQSWGKMFVSKHHYAIQLARRGNQVYFLNPPMASEPSPGVKIRVAPSGIEDGLFFIEHCLSFPYNIKFHFPALFHALMRPHVRRILRTMGKPVDIIWSFDLGNLYPFRQFPSKAMKIFHPVDEPLNPAGINSAKGAQVIFSVTREILDKYEKFSVPRHFINHGIADTFLRASQRSGVPAGQPVRVGLSGNFLREDIDRQVLLEIVKANPELIFECWGSYTIRESNLAGREDESTVAFLRELRSMKNVLLHGSVTADVLSSELHRMDAFLICYDIQRDQSGGTNYHKVMEYLSTGKVIISNNITTYKQYPELVQMVEERDNNRNLPGLFKKVVAELDQFNAPHLQERRIAFAADNTYIRQIERIEKKLPYTDELER